MVRLPSEKTEKGRIKTILLKIQGSSYSRKSTFSRTVLPTEVSGSEIRGMAMVNRCGLMERSTRVSGATIRLMVRASSGTQTAMSTMEIGVKIKPMAEVFMCMSTGLSMMETGMKICSTVMELRRGLMDRASRVNMSKEERKGTGPTTGLTEASTLETGKTTNSKER